MTQEEKQLLFKDLSARLYYGVKFALSNHNIYTIKGIDLIVTDEGDWDYAVTAKGIEPIEIKYIKPYLRPMSSMTVEEAYEYELLIDCSDYTYFKTSDKVIDWLNANHFDYRGLIPMGLALESPDGMYK